MDATKRLVRLCDEVAFEAKASLTKPMSPIPETRLPSCG
jgi:hypothetical protein